VICTNIVCRFITTNDLADLYLVHYIRYRSVLAKLFPHGGLRPNHHYAMHIALLLKFWGPLMASSEFPYERHNGTFQKVKTNGHMHESSSHTSTVYSLLMSITIGDLDLTMLRQICRHGRLLAILAVDESDVGKILEDQNDSVQTVPVGPSHILTSLGDLYNPLHSYVNRDGLACRHYRDVPHPHGSTVLSIMAEPVTYFEFQGRPYSVRTANAGNSAIAFLDGNGVVLTGFIASAWHACIGKAPRTFLFVEVHEQLSNQDSCRSPYRGKAGLFTKLVYTSLLQPQVVIEPEAIISGISYFNQPASTFRIHRETTIVHVVDRGLSGKLYDFHN
jgi:hypothetical protein